MILWSWVSTLVTEQNRSHNKQKWLINASTKRLEGKTLQVKNQKLRSEIRERHLQGVWHCTDFHKLKTLNLAGLSVCARACAHVRVRTCVCVHAHVHVCVCVCMCVCLCVCADYKDVDACACVSVDACKCVSTHASICVTVHASM